MNKIVLDIEIDEKFLKDNCIIVYRDKKWQVVPRESYLGDVVAKLVDKHIELEERIDKLEDNLLKLAQIVKEK